MAAGADIHPAAGVDIAVAAPDIRDIHLVVARLDIPAADIRDNSPAVADMGVCWVVGGWDNRPRTGCIPWAWEWRRGCRGAWASAVVGPGDRAGGPGLRRTGCWGRRREERQRWAVVAVGQSLNLLGNIEDINFFKVSV